MQERLIEELESNPFSCKCLSGEMINYIRKNYTLIESSSYQGRRWFMVYKVGTDSKYCHFMICPETKERRNDTADEFYHHTDFDYR